MEYTPQMNAKMTIYTIGNMIIIMIKHGSLEHPIDKPNLHLP